jgi:hypothetical protein
VKINEWFKENMKDWKKPISASGIMTALSCERKFLFANKWRLYRKARQYSASATFGKLLHRLLQVGEEGVEEVHQEVIKQHEALLQQIREGEDLMGDIKREADGLHASYTKALAVAKIFWEKYPPAEHMETVCREERIDGELDRVPSNVPTTGYMDWVVRDKRDGSVWIRDTKTTSRKFASILTGFSYCIPCRFYRLLALNRPWGKDVKGFILDMVKVPTIKLCGKDEKNAAAWECTVMEAYIKRVKEWYEEQEEEAMKSVAIKFNEPVDNSELFDALLEVSDIWEVEALPENFSKDLTKSTCYAYEKECPYYVLCSSDPVTWPSIIEQMFEVVPEHKDRKEKK